MLPDWHTAYLDHPLYALLRPFVSQALPPTWPDQAAYDRLMTVARAAGVALPDGLRFVCDLTPEAYYETHVGKTGEVPTRYRNWHDWFNALAWLAWPRAKAALNRRHVRAIARGEVRRGPLRDAATLLDECGVLVPVGERALAEALTGMQWKTLFIAHRSAWGTDIDVMPIGHALWETGLAPHIGWCAKALPVAVPSGFFGQPLLARLAWLDDWLARSLEDDTFLPRPRTLCPLPLLGIPGYWPANEEATFYDNAAYFRSTRRANASSETSSVSVIGESSPSSA
ncbi:DUF3025 domain-containing protein [Gulbenkiania mobilis]|uniref:DUF3025 family protein n=1 Tax=Gulbenkiania mobilis TaxID=397457 RepID=A0ABY2CWS9_GULMO|nr:DUF3025 family protein [Gulbenkiania mobilis]